MARKRLGAEFLVVSKPALDAVVRDLEATARGVARVPERGPHNRIYEDVLARKVTRVRTELALLRRLGLLEEKDARRILELF